MTEAIEKAVDAALNPETFDIFEYLKDQPVATDLVTLYVDVEKCIALEKLKTSRAETLASRREDEAAGKASSLSLADDDEDTEFDDEINSLLEDLESSKLIFHIQTVAPSLRKAIERKYKATAKGMNDEELAEHNRKATADVLSRAISHVERADGSRVGNVWDAETLLRLEDELYEEQGRRLIGSLWQMVYTGEVFDNAITADFS